ncbi:MAG: hypothetical protein Q4F95_10745 [Oscillospiraceae bacterium]|nr:hypothetical protein [Oscillospiraceae bacterium]
MTPSQLADKLEYRIINMDKTDEKQIAGPFCCDLLSLAMSRLPAGCAWVTVMANINTLAVASLTDAACIVLAENAVLDDAAVSKACEQQITVLCSDKPVFETSLEIYEAVNDKAVL